MSLKKIILSKYRNFKEFNLILKSGINIIIGPNGIGKTNLVYSINLLTNPQRFSKKSNIIKKGDSFSIIKGEFNVNNLILNPSIHIEKNTRKFFVDDKQVKILDFINIANSFIYTTKEFNDFMFFPKKRRSYIDNQIIKVDKDYLILLNNFKKILKERNQLLKSNNSNLLLFETIDHKLTNIQIKIIKKREEFINEVNKHFKHLTKLNGWELKINYKKIFNYFNLKKEILKKLIKNFELDKKLKYTSSSINQDDFLIFQNINNNEELFSQGQKKFIYILLILSCLQYIKQNSEKHQILILDDILNELDEKNRNKLIKILPNSQIIITTTNQNFIDDLSLKKINIIEVSHE